MLEIITQADVDEIKNKYTMRHFINLVENMKIEKRGMTAQAASYLNTEEDLIDFAKGRGSVERFAALADEGTPAHEFLTAFYHQAETEGKLAPPAFFHIPREGVMIAKRLGATGYQGIGNGKATPWSSRYSDYMGGTGYVITTPDGRVFLDTSVERGDLYLPQISTEERGTGLGHKTMEAIRDVCREEGWGLVIYKVTNRKFFQKFDWLEEDKHGNFKGKW